MKNFTHILAIDTALSGCGVCAGVAGQGAPVSLFKDMRHGQAQYLVPMIDEALKTAALAYADIDTIVTTIGPGAFTGLRIGLSTAKAMAMALDVPLLGISTLQALAFQYAWREEAAKEFCVVLETRRQDFYVQRFDAQGKALGAPDVLAAQDIDLSCPVLGDGVERLQQELDSVCEIEGFTHIEPQTLFEVIERGAHDVLVEAPEPLYLRGADVSVSKRKQRVIAER